ncbi:MAG: thioredoxin family protein [Agriterribacter sp.]
MKFILSLVAAICTLPIYAQPTTIAAGAAAPFIKLKNVDNKMISFNDYPSAKGFIIVFMSNTCPYSKAYEERITQLSNKYGAQHFPVIAVNANNPEVSPENSFANMQAYAKSQHFVFPYLCDEKQEIADKYGARSTPQVFIVSKKGNEYTVEYTGAIDNDTQNNKPDKVNYVEDAMTALLNNTKPAVTHTKAIGCSISRKKV